MGSVAAYYCGITYCTNHYSIIFHNKATQKEPWSKIDIDWRKNTGNSTIYTTCLLLDASDGKLSGSHTPLYFRANYNQSQCPHSSKILGVK